MGASDRAGSLGQVVLHNLKLGGLKGPLWPVNPARARLYQAERRNRRDMAVMLLVDVSGSTDSWVAGDKRVIDVEREALLLDCIALEGMAEPYSVLAFSGEGPQAVVVRSIKRFDQPDDARWRFALPAWNPSTTLVHRAVGLSTQAPPGWVL